MDPFLGVMFVLWFVKTLVEDGYSTVKGTSNPRMDRRKARQKSRAGNPIWTQFVGWLGDVAEDARTEQARARQEKRERQAEQRRKRDLEEHPTVDAEYEIHPDGYNPDPADPSVKEVGTPPPVEPQEERRRHEDLGISECEYDFCPVHGKPSRRNEEAAPQPTDPTPNNDQRSNNMPNQAGADAGNFLDGSISYCEEAAAGNQSFGQVEGEGFLTQIAAHQVQGRCYDAVVEAQAMSMAAAAKWDDAKAEFEKQKTIQEGYRNNSDAGDKDFQTGG
jgi:hypothetical protein